MPLNKYTSVLYYSFLKSIYLKKMSEKYKVIDSTVSTFITITVVDWVESVYNSRVANALFSSHK
ncbi:hypothetical protein FNW12_04475 [Flavobacterium gawalongense]|uniref:Transposase n=1 Tax=Flavobacterium gawalongense TaxID=2594432 RepID=A0ABY3CNH2_9FLAO|nr:hypothetical protein FNW33_08750 [Flavobacterium gawalongense]TRX08504.1 hypothetical protein FNW12_04475 [Flavobacterium gawalongense]